MKPTKEVGVAAEEAWRKMFDWFVGTRWRRDEVLERLGLTPNDAKAIDSLHRERGKPMGVLAREWGSDRSAVTWVVDRLESLGYAERLPDPSDRRVRLVVLTERGEAVATEIRRAFYQPPPEILALEREDLDTLNRVLDRLVTSGTATG